MNRLSSKLLSLLNIHAGEGRLVLLVLIYAILLYTANVLARTASYALFLAEFDAQTLPYAYIGIAIFGPLVSAIYLKLNQRFSLSLVLIVVHGFLLLTLAGYRLGLGLLAAPWLLFSLPIYFGVNNSLTISSFWNLLGRIYNLQQGKRLFGLLSSGEHVATIATGFMAPILVTWVGTSNLFLVGALVMVGTLGVLIYILRTNVDKMEEAIEESTGPSKKRAGNLLEDRYVRLIFGLFTLFIVGVYFVDNIFYSQAEIQFPTEDELAGFIGNFFGVFGVLSLLVQLFVAGRVLTRFGVRAMLLATPAGLLITIVLFALVGTFTQWLIVIFWLVVAANMYRSILDAVDSAAVNIMYQPLPARQRTQAQTTVMGVIYPLSIGVAGLAMLFFFSVLNFGPVQLAYVLLFILAAWLVTGVLLGRAYPKRLQQALNQRSLSHISMPGPDRSSLAIFQQGLTSPHIGVVVYSLDMLEEIAPESMADSLPDLLDHQEPEIRLEALRRIERLGLTTSLEAVSRRLQVETSSPVRVAALRTLATLDETGAIEQIYPYLEEADPQVRLGALVGLLRNGGVETTMIAEGKLLQLAVSSEPADRLLATQVVGEVAAPNMRQLLAQFLEDDNLWVRRTALAAAGKAKYFQLWPLVLAGLTVRETRSAAAAALVAGGEAVVPAIQTAFAQPDQEREVLIRLARVCGRIGGERVTAHLLDCLEFPDEGVRAGILAALSRCGFRATEEAIIRRQIKAEVAKATTAIAVLVDIDDGSRNGQATEAVTLLAEALRNKLTRHQTNIFFLLSFVYDAQTVLRAWDVLHPAASSSEEKQAYALEAIDILVAKELKGMLWPLLRDLAPIERLHQLRTDFPQTNLDRPQRLRELITEPLGRLDPWLLACTLYTVGRLGLSTGEMIEAVVATLRSKAADSLVREIAVWTLAMLDDTASNGYISRLRHDPSPQVAGAIKQLELFRNGDKRMLLTIEKVVILKSVSIFVSTPDEILADVADLLQEVELEAGETIFEKGDKGDCMYIVVSGQVRVHDGNHTFNHLGDGDVFGEMAILDSEPRLASVTAIEDTRLLRLDRQPFYELMEDRIEVAQGIIRVLSGYLRKNVRDVTELNTRMQDLIA